jgi:SAM-dependent methyltransferase
MTDTPETANWYRDWFDEDYLALYAHRDENEAHRFADTIWNRLNLSPGVRIGDLPCGPGRYTKTFAERGAIVTGLDLSEVMLKHARAAVQHLVPQPRLLAGDLRKLPFDSEFDLVANLFTSFGYFEDEAENEKTFSELVRVLVPGGNLIIDVVNAKWLISNFKAEDKIVHDGVKATTRKELVDDNRRVIKRIQLQRGGQTREIVESVRLYTPNELTSFANRHGLKVLDFWGDYEGKPWTDNSNRLILIARK